MTTQEMPTTAEIASAESGRAAQSAARCDVLYQAYDTATAEEAQAWRLVRLFSYATAVLIIVSVVLTFFSGQSEQLASAGVALLSSIGAGAFATRASQKRKEMHVAAAGYVDARCGSDRLIALMATE